MWLEENTQTKRVLLNNYAIKTDLSVNTNDPVLAMIIQSTEKIVS